MLTDNANKLLSIDFKSSLNKPKDILSFVSNILGSLTSKTFSVTSTFTPFMFDDPGNNKIYAFKLRAIIPPSEQGNYQAANFKVKRLDSDIKLFYNDQEFPYPYCLLTMSLSNYVRLTWLPSDYVAKNTLINLSAKDVEDISAAMIKNKDRLSSNQSKYELFLLEYLKTYLAIKKGEDVQRLKADNTDRDLQLIQAYNYIFDFSELEDQANAMNSTGRALFDRYQKWIAPVRDQIIKSAKNLDYTDLCMNVYKIKSLKPEEITNSQLQTLNNYKTKARGIPYLQQVKFYYDVDGKESDCEEYLYKTKFKPICEDVVMNSNSSSQSIESLMKLKAVYADCKLCQDKAYEAETRYEQISGDRKLKDVNLIVIRAMKTIEDFKTESTAWLSTSAAKINDSKDSTGTPKLKMPFEVTAFNTDAEAIKNFQKKFDDLKNSKNKGDAETAEKELMSLIDKFRKTYFKPLENS